MVPVLLVEFGTTDQSGGFNKKKVSPDRRPWRALVPSGIRHAGYADSGIGQRCSLTSDVLASGTQGHRGTIAESALAGHRVEIKSEIQVSRWRKLFNLKR